MPNHNATRAHKHHPIPGKIYGMMRQMHAQGMNDFAIAEHLGISSRTVWEFRKRNGLNRWGRRPKSKG